MSSSEEKLTAIFLELELKPLTEGERRFIDVHEQIHAEFTRLTRHRRGPNIDAVKQDMIVNQAIIDRNGKGSK